MNESMETLTVDRAVYDERGKSAKIVKLEENRLVFRSSSIDLPHYVTNSFMFRRNEQPYIDACENDYTLDIFPPILKEGVKYKNEYVQLCRYVLGLRIRRLVLIQEVSSFSTDIKTLKSLMNQCREKESGLEDRIRNLETEIEALIPYDNSAPTSKFNALLAAPQAWHMICIYLNKELKRFLTTSAEATKIEDNHNPSDRENATSLVKGIELFTIFYIYIYI